MTSMEPEYVALKWLFDKINQSITEDQLVIDAFKASGISEQAAAVPWFEASQNTTRKARQAVCEAFGVHYADYYEPAQFTGTLDKFLPKGS